MAVWAKGCNMIFRLKTLCALFVIAGTYILSKQLFEHSFKQPVNFKFSELPLSLKLVIIVFGDKRKFENRELWMGEMFPIPGSFPWRKKLKITEPFIGFILICLGTIVALFLK